MIQVQTLRSIFYIVPVKELGAVKGLKRCVFLQGHRGQDTLGEKHFKPYASLFAGF